MTDKAASPVLSRSAVLSDDGVYRYRLGRRWGEGPAMTYVMLNPSIADHAIDDQTIRRCVYFANREGCGAIDVVNLYALRSTHPGEIKRHSDPIGPENHGHLHDAITGARFVVAAWGNWCDLNHRTALRRDVARLCRDEGRPLHCLGVTKSGQPRHPSRLGNDAPLLRWPVVTGLVNTDGPVPS